MIGLMRTVWFITTTDKTGKVLIIYSQKKIPTFQQYSAVLSLKVQWVKGRSWQLSYSIAIKLYHFIFYSVSYLDIRALVCHMPWHH